MERLTGCQRLCFRVIGLVFVLYMCRHYAPQELVDWGWDIESPLWTTIFGNNQIFHFTDTFAVNRVFPLFIFLFSATYVYFMYDIADIWNFFRQPVQNNKGFTLVEAMVVVAIIGILSSIAVINLNKDSYKLGGETSHIRGLLQLCKMESVKTRENVYFGFNNANPNVVDIYVGKNLKRRHHINYNVKIVDINVPAGNIPNQSAPTTVPQSVMDQCLPPTPLAQCQALNDWLDQFKSESYDHLLVFTSIGIPKTHGEFYMVLNQTRIPVTVGVAGIIKVGTREQI